jgi:TolB-like protein/Tfp pilus assembly protein PilF
MDNPNPQSTIAQIAAPLSRWLALWHRLRVLGKMIAGIAALGAVLSGLVGYFNVYKLLADPTLASSVTEAPRLSLVVLPFANTSGDPAQDYVADAITDDITIELSQIKGSFVIGRGTAFAYRGQAQNIKAIAKELNVRYVLQGTAARLGSKFHITAQLINGATGANLWGTNLDVERDRADDLRRDLVRQLAGALNWQLISAEIKQASVKSNPDAVDLTMKVRLKQNQNVDYNERREILDKALKLDPNYTPALILRANLAAEFVAFNSPQQGRDAVLAQGETDARRAIALDSSDASAHKALAEVLRFQGRIQEAIVAITKALELNPNQADIYGLQARMLVEEGDPAAALEPAAKALSLSPLDPDLESFFYAKCYAHSQMGDFSNAVIWCEKSWRSVPAWYSGFTLLASYAAINQTDKVETLKPELTRRFPDFTIGNFLERKRRVKSPAFWTAFDTYIAPNLRKAGVPEQ